MTVYWITGRSGAGKTTLAHRLQKQIPNSVILDGDEIREIFQIKDYSKISRVKNLNTIVRIAKLLEKQGLTPIIACISPDLLQRKKYQAHFKECIEICLPFGQMWEGTEYEETEK